MSLGRCWWALRGILAAGLLAGCAASQPSVLPDAAAPSPSPPVEYAVQPGDTLAVKFYYHPDHDQEVVVRTDGKIALALVGEVHAAGLSPARLANEIAQRYSTNLRDPQVSVSVKAMGENRVYVGGEVNRPGFVAYRQGLTALKALMEAGGPKDTGRLDQVVLLHKGTDDGQYVASKINLARVLEAGDTGADLAVGPADVLFVPKTTIAKLNLFVEQYVIRMLPFRPSLPLQP